jgi:hypothetical protein
LINTLNSEEADVVLIVDVLSPIDAIAGVIVY